MKPIQPIAMSAIVAARLPCGHASRHIAAHIGVSAIRVLFTCPTCHSVYDVTLNAVVAKKVFSTQECESCGNS